METNVITKIDFFDFMRCFFTDADKYSKLTQNAKKSHIFMFKRMMSMMYPIQMNAISGIDDIRLVDILHKSFCTGVYPKWMYTSTKDQGSTQKISLVHKKYGQDVIDAFLDRYKCEYKCILELEELNREWLETEIKLIDKDLNLEVKKTPVKKKAND